MSLHQDLKKATDSLHTKLENDLDLLRTDLSLDDYVTMLKGFYGFYKALEEQYPIPLERKKTHLLIEDLAFFGVKDLSQISLFSSFPNNADESFLMGVSYVIEGSTLGGSILSRHFKEKFNLSDEGVRFFSAYGAETFSRWRVFLDRLESFSHSKDCSSESVKEGAVFTFSSLHDWLIN